MRRSIKGQRATLPPQPSRGFSRFFFEFLPYLNRLIDTLCGRVGSGGGGGGVWGFRGRFFSLFSFLLPYPFRRLLTACYAV